MKDIIEASGWVSIGSNEAKTYFSAVDKPFSEHTVNLEVIVGEKVLVNGELFHSQLIPTVEEALEFSQALCDEAEETPTYTAEDVDYFAAVYSSPY